MNSLFYLLRMDTKRQDKAIEQGFLSFFTNIAKSQQKLKQFAIPILCELVRNRSAFYKLWNSDLLSVLLELLFDPCWKISVLDAIIYW